MIQSAVSFKDLLQAKPSNTQLVMAFYSAARAEIVQRLSLREQTFLAWITTTGVVLGFALRNNQDVNLTALKIIPLLSLPFVFVIYRHHKIIHHIST